MPFSQYGMFTTSQSPHSFASLGAGKQTYSWLAFWSHASPALLSHPSLVTGLHVNEAGGGAHSVLHVVSPQELSAMSSAFVAHPSADVSCVQAAHSSLSTQAWVSAQHLAA